MTIRLNLVALAAASVLAAPAFAASSSSASIGPLTVQLFNRVEVGVYGYSYTSPVPEPETWALMLAGLLTVGSMARRRRG